MQAKTRKSCQRTTAKEKRIHRNYIRNDQLSPPLNLNDQNLISQAIQVGSGSAVKAE